ncbi:hypothetical protein [Chitinimonas sp.]|uniref:hypothetical protein n=1 Tax=Chitinimonas sp. TaxID=1934313 RepID=UPI0035B2553C
MTRNVRLQATLLAATFVTLSPSVLAHGGEDHGDAPPAVTAGPGLNPRTEAKSETFELLTEQSGPQLTLYLDRYADNAPVSGAHIEVESAAFKGVATPQGDHYVLQAAPLTTTGSHPLVFTVTAGDDSDLLESTLVVDGHPVEQSGASNHRWLWLAAGGLAAAVLIAVVRKRRAGNPEKV